MTGVVPVTDGSFGGQAGKEVLKTVIQRKFVETLAVFKTEDDTLESRVFQHLPDARLHAIEEVGETLSDFCEALLQQRVVLGVGA